MSDCQKSNRTIFIFGHIKASLKATNGDDVRKEMLQIVGVSLFRTKLIPYKHFTVSRTPPYVIECVAGAKNGEGEGEKSGKGKGRGSACYKSRYFCIPPTNFPTNPIMSTVNT